MSTRYYRDEEHVTDGAPTGRQHNSVRRYVPQPTHTQRLQQEPAPVRARRTTGDVAQYENDHFYDPYEHEVSSRRVPSRSTGPVRRVVPQYADDDEDEYVERHERPARPERRVRADVQRHPVREEKLKADQQSRRSFITDVAITIGLGAAVMTLFGSAASAVQSVVVHNSHQLEEGEIANKRISLVCGHHDSAANPTQLQASLYDDGTIRFMEFPGGDTSRATFSFTPSIREAYHGDLSNVYLQIIPEQVTRTTYRIRLHMEIREMGPWTNASAHDWFYVDDGKGKFVATK